jgi:multisubunit Na+/H+ antiporter MnhB subunit
VRDVLNALAVMIARDVAARREIEAERAQHRTTLRWIAIFVGGFTIFAVLNRAYSSPYGTLPGEVVLALVTGLYAAGLGWLYRLGAMSTPGRFLAGPDARADQPGRPGDLTITGSQR